MEDDFRRMPTALREALVKWYFDERLPIPSVIETPMPEPATEAAPLPGQIDFVDGNRRITFAELLRAGVLKQGDEIYCKSLKRQQRAGSEAFIKGAKVTDKGTVDFLGKRFSNPSKLAMAMVNTNGGNAKALNGYDYLFVQTPKYGPLPLNELRRQLIEGTPAEKGAVAELMETGAFSSAEEALDYVREEPRSMFGPNWAK